MDKAAQKRAEAANAMASVDAGFWGQQTTHHRRQIAQNKPSIGFLECERSLIHAPLMPVLF